MKSLRMRGACLIVIITYLHSSMSLYYWCADDLRICFYTNGTNYKMITSEAQQTCRRNESILLEIYNKSYENAFINAWRSWNLGSGFPLLLNLGKINGTYKWLNSNVEISYTNWKAGEPSWSSPCSCLNTDENYNWQAQDCSSKYPFLCMKESSSATEKSPQTNTTPWVNIPASPTAPFTSLFATGTTATTTSTTTTATPLKSSINEMTPALSVTIPFSDKSRVKADGAARNLSESSNVALAVALPLTIIFIVLAVVVAIVWIKLKRPQWLNIMTRWKQDHHQDRPNVTQNWDSNAGKASLRYADLDFPTFREHDPTYAEVVVKGPRLA